MIKKGVVSHVLFMIFHNLTVDIFSIVVIVRKRVVDLSEGEVREFCNKLLRRTPMLEYVGGHRANWEPRAVDNGTSPAKSGIVRDMRVGNFGHLGSPSVHKP